MNDRRLDVQWVPCDPTQFITWGTDLRHYRVVPTDPAPELGCLKEPLSACRAAILLGTVSEPHYIKCVDIWAGEGVVVAAGQASGRISFVSFRDGEGKFLLDKDLSPRTPRQCTALAWHKGGGNTALLASGYEKHRSDYGVLVWDLGQQRVLDKPVVELGMTDSCCSLAWFRAGHSIAAGVNGKMVRLCDTRVSHKLAATTLTRATNGLIVDPSFEYRLAGHADNQVMIWDTRNFEKPVVSLDVSRPVAKLAWCPTRPGLLANAGRDSGCVQLHDIMAWAVGQEDGEPSVTDRIVEPPVDIGNISAFAWHPTQENTLLGVGSTGRFAEWTVSDRLTINWSARHCLVWSAGRAKLRSAACELNNDIKDIAVLMQERSKEGYAGSGSLADAGSKAHCPELAMTWSWLQHASDLIDSGQVRSVGRGARVPGVRSVLKSRGRSEVKQIPWTGMKSGKSVSVYCSEERDTVLKLCGWKGSKSLNLPETEHLAVSARKAAVSIFNLDLRKALKELQAGAALARNEGNTDLSNILNMVCVAVSGYTSEGDSDLWKEMVSSSQSSLPHPALRAIFAFLTCQDDQYTSVLEEDGLLLVDRLAFAVTFLSDILLEEYIEREWRNMVNAGRIDALVLSGGDSEGVELVQKFVDRTGDVQTACWLAVRVLTPDLAKTDQVSAWVESYRTILDQWTMFTERAELDIALTASNASSQPCQQVFVCCHFCGKSVSPWYKGLPKGGQTGSLSRQGGGGNKAKIQSCPNCKKPLPRCAVCLVNMGTASSTSGLNFDNKPSKGESKLSQFSSWFSWCQTCRHGGHASHLLDWFSDHSDCPVTGCSCKCAMLDSGC